MKKTIIIILTIVITSCSNNSSNGASQKVEDFFTCLNNFQKANNIGSELYNLSKYEVDDKEREMKELMKEGIQESLEFSSEFLNSLHPDLSFYFNSKLVRSNKLFLDGAFSNDNSYAETIEKQEEANQLINEWATYWESNKVEIIKNSKQQKSSEKSFWKMALMFFVASILILIIFSIFTVVVLMPIVIIIGKIKALRIPFMVILSLSQVYFWLLWSSFCFATVKYYMDTPQVSYEWIYYLAGFVVLTGPIGYLSSKEQQSTNNRNEEIKKGTAFYGIISIIAFIVFCFWPSLITYDYLSFVNNFIY